MEVSNDRPTDPLHSLENVARVQIWGLKSVGANVEKQIQGTLSG